jgi:hypothetical protein
MFLDNSFRDYTRQYLILSGKSQLGTRLSRYFITLFKSSLISVNVLVLWVFRQGFPRLSMTIPHTNNMIIKQWGTRKSVLGFRFPRYFITLFKSLLISVNVLVLWVLRQGFPRLKKIPDTNNTIAKQWRAGKSLLVTRFPRYFRTHFGKFISIVAAKSQRFSIVSFRLGFPRSNNTIPKQWSVRKSSLGTDFQGFL